MVDHPGHAVGYPRLSSLISNVMILTPIPLKVVCLPPAIVGLAGYAKG